MNTAGAQAFWSEHPADAGWVAHYRNSEHAPHRRWVVAALREAQPWGSVFEVGCHCGPMLSVIQREWPGAVVSGCDINREAVSDARARFPRVVAGAFPAVTARWPDRSVDVVLSCYTFAYFDPLDIEAALKEAGRLAKRAVVLAEPIAWDVGDIGVIDREAFGEWRHAYLDLLMGIPEFQGWTAHCVEVEYQRLSGLIRVMRP